VAAKESIINSDSFEIAAELAKELKNKTPGITMIHFLPSALDIISERAIEGFETFSARKSPYLDRSPVII